MVSPYWSAINPGRPSDSECTRRQALLCSSPQRRRETDSSRRLRRKAASTTSFGSNDHARARICEDGEYAAVARKAPSDEVTVIISPAAGSCSTRSTAPEKTQGWRCLRDFSRPGFRTRRGDTCFMEGGAAGWTGILSESERMETRLDRFIVVKVGDITKEDVDAIVNAANPSLMGGGGVDGAIHRAGGPEIVAECRQIRKTYPDGLPTGEAAITTAGKLMALHVVHTV